MKKSILALTMLGLTMGLVAQNTPAPQKLKALAAAGVEAKYGAVVDTDSMVAGVLTKPVHLKAQAGKATNQNRTYYKACSSLSAGLVHSSKWGPPRFGAYVNNQGNVNADTKTAGYARGLKQGFEYAYTGKGLNGKLRIYFSGYARGGAKVSASFGAITWKNDPQKSSFSFNKEIKITNQTNILQKFQLTCATGPVNAPASYSARFYVYFYPEVALPTLKWTVPTTQGANCGAGAIGVKGTVGFGQKFDITLTGATDAAKTNPVAFLFTGDSITKWFFLPLPLQLSGKCELRIALFHSNFGKIENQAATFPMMIGSHYGKYFRNCYFQIAYTCVAKTNDLDLVFTKYGMLEKK